MFHENCQGIECKPRRGDSDWVRLESPSHETLARGVEKSEVKHGFEGTARRVTRDEKAGQMAGFNKSGHNSQRYGPHATWIGVRLSKQSANVRGAMESSEGRGVGRRRPQGLLSLIETL